MKKAFLSICLILLALCLLFSGCAARGKIFIRAGKEKISFSVYRLYLSRMKGSLAAAGEEVDNAKYWATYLNTDNLTTAEYYENQVFEGLKQIAAALLIYEEEGLRLDKETEKEIEEWIDALIEDLGEGSKSQLNSVLAAYGANITTLRDAARIEAKIAQLKTHLYGENGELVSDSAKEEFYQATYFRGRQMLISASYHDHEKDADGNTVYFLLDDAGNLLDRIAYDTENGTPSGEIDRFGDAVYRKAGGVAYDTENGTPSAEKARDDRGDLIYYTEEGKIAYDTAKGHATEEKDANGDTVYRKMIVAYLRDTEKASPRYYYETKDGKEDEKIVSYSEEEMEKRRLVAQKIAEDVGGNTARFLAYAEEYSDSLAFDAKYAPNGLYFAKGATTGDSLFNTLSAALFSAEVGTVTLLSSDAGYYLLLREELDDGAYANSENSVWFATFSTLLTEAMLQKRAEPYLEKLKINEKLKENADIASLAANVSI